MGVEVGVVATLTSAGVRCPVCGIGVLSTQDMDPQTGMVRCSCGHEAFAGYIAEVAYLDEREEWLRSRIVGGDGAPSPDVIARYGIWDPRQRPTPMGPALPPVPAAVPARKGTGVQTLLLGVGVLLLVVAAAVFTAVAWTRLGATGQLALVIGATVGVSLLAIALRHRLHGTAEALAVLGFGLVVVDLVAAPGLEVLPEEWLEVDSAYWLVALLALAGLALLAGHRFALHGWVWLGWMAIAGAGGVGAAVVAEAAGGGGSAMAASLSVTAVTGVLLLTGSWLTTALSADRWPMVIAGSVALGAAAVAVAGVALSGDALVTPALTTLLTTAALLGVLPLMAADRPEGLTALAAVLVGVSAGLLLALPLPGGALAMAPLVGLAGGAVLVGGVVRGRGLVGLVVAVPLWLTWLALLVSREGQPPSSIVPNAAGILLAVVAGACLTAAWLGTGDASVSWLAWPAAPLALAAAALLAPEGYPDVLEAWTLPFAAALLISGLVAGRGRPVGSLERVGPALAVALLPSALATWGAPWVTDSDDDPTGHLLRLVLVLTVSGVLAVVGARMHALGVLLPAACALVVAAGAQVWTGLETLPRWVALGLVGALLVLAGARFEWVRSEGRRARAWMHQMS